MPPGPGFMIDEEQHYAVIVAVNSEMILVREATNYPYLNYLYKPQ